MMDLFACNLCDNYVTRLYNPQKFILILMYTDWNKTQRFGENMKTSLHFAWFFTIFQNVKLCYGILAFTLFSLSLSLNRWKITWGKFSQRKFIFNYPLFEKILLIFPISVEIFLISVGCIFIIIVFALPSIMFPSSLSLQSSS